MLVIAKAVLAVAAVVAGINFLFHFCGKISLPLRKLRVTVDSFYLYSNTITITTNITTNSSSTFTSTTETNTFTKAAYIEVKVYQIEEWE